MRYYHLRPLPDWCRPAPPITPAWRKRFVQSSSSSTSPAYNTKLQRRQFEAQTPLQSEIRRIGGSSSSSSIALPAPRGYLGSDAYGNVYVKQSEHSTGTGWKKLATKDMVDTEVSNNFGR